DDERPGVYRRLGDLALFLTGVFPDHTEKRGLRPHDEGRLLRLSGIGPDRFEPGSTGAVELLERLGQRWYQLATRTASVPTASMEVIADVAGRFGLARRTLNYLADRHLFAPHRDWFGQLPT
ncbi:MAG TPA: hypothetical protein VFO97_02325, partial [Desertimonas sp.]|nr:hypothetical protein [Desertimonas sp.]